MHDRFARGEDAFAVGIARRIRQIADHVLLDFLRRVKTEYRQVADVQFDDFLTVILHLPGAVHDGAADVIADVG